MCPLTQKSHFPQTLHGNKTIITSLHHACCVPALWAVLVEGHLPLDLQRQWDLAQHGTGQGVGAAEGECANVSLGKLRAAATLLCLSPTTNLLAWRQTR